MINKVGFSSQASCTQTARKTNATQKNIKPSFTSAGMGSKCSSECFHREATIILGSLSKKATNKLGTEIFQQSFKDNGLLRRIKAKLDVFLLKTLNPYSSTTLACGSSGDRVKENARFMLENKIIPLSHQDKEGRIILNLNKGVKIHTFNNAVELPREERANLIEIIESATGWKDLKEKVTTLSKQILS